MRTSMLNTKSTARDIIEKTRKSSIPKHIKEVLVEV
jgi:hypothetical protein